ncbi:MAG: S8 family serine peptidase [Deltaproteobacteria bacterium]|nr:S8 family serine peptidase [Deltaproteobacteria bacterium]
MAIEEASRYGTAGFLDLRLALATMLVLVASGSARGQSVGTEVLDALNAAGRARVVVALRHSQELESAPADRQASVQARQGAVLSRISVDHFAETQRFESIPALAGTVNSRGLAALLSDPNVIRVDLDEPGSGELAQSLPLIGADILQEIYGLTGAGVTVAVLDTGVARNHPDVASAIIAEQCFCSGGGGCCLGGNATRSGWSAAYDDHHHGTHVTSIITGKGLVAPVGVAPGTRIVAVKVLDANNRFCCSSDVIAGLDWILANRPDVRVVNMSLGTDTIYEGDCDTQTASTMAYARAIDALTERGVAVFAASGNAASPNAMKAPACVANAISVGAVDDDGKVARFSDSGATLDLLAPGVGILAAMRGGGVRLLSGTSMATPHAAGAAALLIEEQARLSPASLLRALVETGTPVTDPRNGLSHPLLDLEAAFLSLELCDDGVDNDEDGLVDVRDPDCPPVEIDIRPGWRHNFLRRSGRGTLRVVLFGFEELDGSDVDGSSLRLGPGGAAPHHDLGDPDVTAGHRVDVDGDGLLDLISHYRIREIEIAPGDEEVCLNGVIAGEAFRACDELKNRNRGKKPAFVSRERLAW